jgi:hypothetical protein
MPHSWQCFAGKEKVNYQTLAALWITRTHHFWTEQNAGWLVGEKIPHYTQNRLTISVNLIAEFPQKTRILADSGPSAQSIQSPQRALPTLSALPLFGFDQIPEGLRPWLP